jgi:hypothetical protein
MAPMGMLVSCWSNVTPRHVQSSRTRTDSLGLHNKLSAVLSAVPPSLDSLSPQPSTAIISTRTAATEIIGPIAHFFTVHTVIHPAYNMALKRKASPGEKYSRSDKDTSSRPPLKYARQQAIVAPPPRTRLRSRAQRESATWKRAAYESRPQNTSPSPYPNATTSCSTQRTAMLKAELANLTDYNVSSAAGHDDDDSDDRTSYPTHHRRSRGSRTVRAAQGVKGGRIKKQPPKQAHKKRDHAGRLQRKVAGFLHKTLGLINGFSDSESEDDWSLCTHSRSYPPRKPGVQNTPWSMLPGEIRNAIYRFCTGKKEEKIVNVRHYPDGRPRRSARGAVNATNFAHSCWGFTQTCQQVRDEFPPLLLEKRNVRTPLDTVNEYVDVFHRPHPATSKRVSRVEPIFTRDALPGNGVEILQLLEHQRFSVSGTPPRPKFHLQLTLTTVSAVLDWFQPAANPDHYDELGICRDMEDLYSIRGGSEMSGIGIEAIHVTSVDMDVDDMTDDGEDSARPHQIFVELEISTPASGPLTRNEQINGLNHFLFKSKLSEKKGVQLTASFAGGKARWEFQDKDTICMRWESRKRSRKDLYRRLTTDNYVLDGINEENLDWEYHGARSHPV